MNYFKITLFSDNFCLSSCVSCSLFWNSKVFLKTTIPIITTFGLKHLYNKKNQKLWRMWPFFHRVEGTHVQKGPHIQNLLLYSTHVGKKNYVHGYEVHEALYQTYEIHGSWLAIRIRERGQFDHIMTMYEILNRGHQPIFFHKCEILLQQLWSPT